MDYFDLQSLAEAATASEMYAVRIVAQGFHTSQLGRYDDDDRWVPGEKAGYSSEDKWIIEVKGGRRPRYDDALAGRLRCSTNQWRLYVSPDDARLLCGLPHTDISSSMSTCYRVELPPLLVEKIKRQIDRDTKALTGPAAEVYAEIIKL